MTRRRLQVIGQPQRMPYRYCGNDPRGVVAGDVLQFARARYFVLDSRAHEPRGKYGSNHTLQIVRVVENVNPERAGVVHYSYRLFARRR